VQIEIAIREGAKKLCVKMMKIALLLFCGFIIAAFGSNTSEIVEKASETEEKSDVRSGLYRPGSITQKIKDKFE
jgi:hypothetical protein